MIHRFKLGGYNIVLDVCSGAVHVTDEVSYEASGLLETMTGPEAVDSLREMFAGREDVTDKDIEECVSEVLSLKASGQLYSPDGV